MAVWTDNHGLSLYPTTSKDYLFLSVNPKIQQVAEPFMKLTEVKAIWNTTAAELKNPGYLIPIDQFLFVNDFLEIFHEVLPPHKPRSRVASGREHDCVELTSGKATIHWLSYQEFRLLMLLAEPDVMKIEPELLEYLGETDKSKITPRLLKSVDALVESNEPKWLQWEGINIFNTDATRDLISRYMVARDADLITGDLVKPYWLEGTEEVSMQYIFDGTKLVDLEYGPLSEYSGVPEQFKVPTPFPVTYWTDIIQFNYQVWPNFDLLAEKMEYVADPPTLPKHMEVVNDEDLVDKFTEFEEENAAALRFEFEGITYYIYFPRITKPSYEEVMGAITDRDTFYYSWTATDMIAHVLWEKEETEEEG